MGTKSATKIDLEMLLGFSDELQKIAGFAPAKMTGLTDVSKAVGKVKGSLMTRPNAVSKAAKLEAPVPAPDFLKSTKTNPPPPITGAM